MHFSQETINAHYVIRSYHANTIQVNEQYLQESFIISTHQLIVDWSAKAFADVNEQTLQAILSLQPEIVILGTGQRLRPLSPTLLTLFLQQNIGLETMESNAACRTYNLLASEGRRVVAGIIQER